MRYLLILLLTLLFLDTGCTKDVKKREICTTIITEPESLQILNKNSGENFGKK